MGKYLDASGVSRLWTKIKSYVAEQISAAGSTSETTGEIDTIGVDETLYWGFTLPSEGIYALYMNISGTDTYYSIVGISSSGSHTLVENFGEFTFNVNDNTFEIYTNYDVDGFPDVEGTWKKLI